MKMNYVCAIVNPFRHQSQVKTGFSACDVNRGLTKAARMEIHIMYVQIIHQMRQTDENTAHCRACTVNLRVHHGDLKKHVLSQNHKTDMLKLIPR